jgi:predicted GNAT superfamily acetyltransferase
VSRPGWPKQCPERARAFEIAGQQVISIEIPTDINALQRQNPELARRWREATRWAFSEALSSNYHIGDFFGASRNGEPVGVYLLSYDKNDNSVA